MRSFAKFVCFDLQKKFILQTGTTSDGVSIIDVVPIDQSDSPDEAPITVSTILPANSVASSPNNSNSQQITAQVAFVQTQDSNEISDAKPHFITVNGKFAYALSNISTYIPFEEILFVSFVCNGIGCLNVVQQSNRSSRPCEAVHDVIRMVKVGSKTLNDDKM